MRRPSGMTIATALAVTAIIYLLVVPLATELISSFRGPYLPFGVPTAKWGIDNYQKLFSLAGGLPATVVATTAYVGGATIISVGLAWSLAWLVVRTDLRLRNVIAVLVLVPYIIPPIVRAQSYLLMLAPHSGLFNQLLRILPWWSGDTGPIDPFSFPALVVIQGFAAVTFPFLLLLPILQNMDGGLEEASRTAGGSPIQTFWRVTLPLLWPATFGIIILQVIILLGSLEIPLLFGQQQGGAIFSLRLWDLLHPNSGQLPQYGLAAAYGVVFLVATTLIFRGYLSATRHAGRRASITGKAFRPNRMALGGWRRWALVAVLLYLVPTAVVPGIALTWAAITPHAMPLTYENLVEFGSLNAFRAVLVDPEFWASMGRTIVIAGGSATIAVTVATVAAYVVARGGPGKGMRVLDVIASSSLAIPAIIAGFASFLFYSVLNGTIPLLGTIWVLMLVYSYRIAVSYRVSHSAVLQISTELEESAATSGATRLTTFRRVVVPLVAPASAAVWIQLFVLGAHEFTLPAFLVTPQNRPLSWYLYAKIDPTAAQIYAPSEGAAMALLFTVFVLVVAFVLRFVVGRRSFARTTVGAARPTDLATPDAAGALGTLT
jgi:iron(III) transport system permease protein